MKTTLELPDDLARRIRMRAAARDQKLKDAIAQLLEIGLAHAPAAPKFVAPAGAQRCACPSPASRGLRLCAVFPAMTDRHRNGAQPHKMERDHA